MGLLRGRSRKRFDPFEARTGEVVRTEAHAALLATYSATVGAGTSTTTILTVPTGFIARVVAASASYDPSGLVENSSIKVDGTPFYLLESGTARWTDNTEFEFEQAPRAANTITFTQTNSAGTSYTIVVRYVLEPASGGYLVSR